MPQPAFVSISRAALTVGVERRVIRELMARGSLEAVDLGIGVAGYRGARYVTTASVNAYIERARRDGAWTLRLCRKCKGERFIEHGATVCSVCANHEADSDAAERRRVRKREWWRQNGAAWRARHKAERDSPPPPTEGTRT